MARKNTKGFLPDEAGHDFSADYDIFNYRPNISFVAPERLPGEPGNTGPADELGDLRNATQDLIDGYDAVGPLCDLAQQRIDGRIAALGGLDINLDSKVDAAVIAAMKRMFPDKTDPTKIGYDEYKSVLGTMAASANPPPMFGPLDIQQAQENPLKTDFMGLSSLPGLNRPETTAGGSSLNPLDLVAFQAQAVVTLFGMMTKLITGLIKKVVGG